jgi:mRNA-degrading endonuclease YafQ of YafQ-DinJ toxin-antitoxin module
MKLHSTHAFDKKLREIAFRNNKLFNRAQKRIEIFILDQNYPSLRLHKLSGCMKELWSFSVDESIRIIFYFQDKETAILVDVGKHEEVYRR